jgi:hypothetical protein
MDKFNTFINSLTSKKKTTSTPFYPTPTGQPVSNTQSNFTNNFGIPINNGATTPAQTKITTPTATPTKSTNTPTLSDAGKKFANNLYDTTTGGRTVYGALQGVPDMLGGKPVSPTQTPTTPTTSPTAPTIDTSGRASAFQSYLDSLKPSTAETEAKTKYLDFVSSAERGISGLEGRGMDIPLSVVRGEQEKLGKQAEITAKRLQGDLTLASEERTALSEQAKAKYEYESDLISEKSDAEQKAYDRLTEKEKVAYDKEQDTKKTELDTKKFEEDKRQFGLEYALAVKKANEPKAPTAAQEAKKIADEEKAVAAQQQASQAIGLVNNLLSGDRYKAISGGIQTGSIPFLGDRTAVNEYDQLQGMLKLGIRGLLKGQGTISDYEGKILGSAASALSRLTSEDQQKEALQTVRGVLKTNNGQITTVNVKNPETGEVVTADLSGAEIYQLVSEGNTITYK